MYAVHDYDSMFADGVRARAYLEAIRRAVRPGDVVVEIGTGVGFFAIAAARAGARRVYAIEMNPAISLGAQVAEDNGCADRITFIHDDSRKVQLPELGDLLLSDMRGVLPLFGEHIPSLVDARARLLKPGATLLPVCDTLMAAPCAAPTQWRRDHLDQGDAPFGIDRRAVAARVRSEWYRCWLDAENLLADAASWATLDYRTVHSANVEGRASFAMAQKGIVDGIAVWFDGNFGFDVALSNHPAEPRSLYGQVFFPFERSLQVGAGDRLDVEMRAHLVQGDYVWAWDSALVPAGTRAPAAVFRQTNLVSRVVSLDQLRAAAQQ